MGTIFVQPEVRDDRIKNASPMRFAAPSARVPSTPFLVRERIMYTGNRKRLFVMFH